MAVGSNVHQVSTRNMSDFIKVISFVRNNCTKIGIKIENILSILLVGNFDYCATLVIRCPAGRCTNKQKLGTLDGLLHFATLRL